MSRSRALIGAGFATGALVGAILTVAVAAPPEAAPPPGDEQMRANTAAQTGETAARPSDTKTQETTSETGEDRQLVATVPAADELLPLLQTFAEEEIRRGWREVRSDAIPDDVLADEVANCIESMLRTPEAYGRRAAKRLDEQERATAAFAGGDGIELLHSIDGSEPECAAFVASKGFLRLFQPRGGGVSLSGPGHKRGAELPAGAVLSYPAGVFDVTDLSRGNEPFPADVTIRGVGMNATLLYLDAQRMRSPLDRFAIEDCTVYCDNAITDVRNEPAVLSLRRVRVIGFDCGAGSCVAFYLGKGAAMFATECRFEGGYGRNPQSYANLMRSSGPCLARFERCTFDRMSLNDIDQASVLFTGCTMNELLDRAPRGPKYQNCRITICDQQKKWNDSYRRRDLNALFPHLGEQLQRR